MLDKAPEAVWRSMLCAALRTFRMTADGILALTRGEAG